MNLGLQMASKAFIIIHDVELGKPHMFPEGGRNSARSYNDIRGRGESKKRMTIGCDKKIHNKLPTSYPFRLG